MKKTQDNSERSVFFFKFMHFLEYPKSSPFFYLGSPVSPKTFFWITVKPDDVFLNFRPTLILEDIVPPFSKLGLVIDGGHFFTFDGHHFSMPGSCSYILSQDIQDGNFSVVANFNNGNLASITVTDPKESITVKSNGNVSQNCTTQVIAQITLDLRFIYNIFYIL